MLRETVMALLGAAALVAAGCGASRKASSPVSGAAASSNGSPGALSAEAQSAATGDIPDNQVFLTFHNSAAKYSIKYPEGWTQTGSGGDVTFRDKNNLVHIVVASGSAPSPASVAAQLKALKSSNPTLQFQAPQTVTIGETKAKVVKAVYTTNSAPNPVTGKRVLLIVERYELAKRGKRAVVDLGTPKGVDNADAYRMMIHSFKWL
jgi:hypothetical protein